MLSQVQQQQACSPPESLPPFVPASKTHLSHSLLFNLQKGGDEVKEAGGGGGGKRMAGDWSTWNQERPLDEILHHEHDPAKEEHEQSELIEEGEESVQQNVSYQSDDSPYPLPLRPSLKISPIRCFKVHPPPSHPSQPSTGTAQPFQLPSASRSVSVPSFRRDGGFSRSGPSASTSQHHHPRASSHSSPLQPAKQGRLLLVSLIENYCNLYEKAPDSLGSASDGPSSIDPSHHSRSTSRDSVESSISVASSLASDISDQTSNQHSKQSTSKGRAVFLAICQHLAKLGIIRPVDWADELGSVRGLYRRGFQELFVNAVSSVEHDLRLRPAAMPSEIRPIDSSPNIALPESTSVSSLTLIPATANIPFPARSSSAHTNPLPFLPLSESLCNLEWISGSRSRYFEDFEELGLLGSGAYGAVYKVRHKLDSTPYAIKKIHFKSSSPKLLREVKYHAKLYHTNLVRYFSAWIEDVDHRKLNTTASFILNGADASSGGATAGDDNIFSSSASFSTISSESSSLPWHGTSRQTMTLFIQMELCQKTLSRWLRSRNTSPQCGGPKDVNESEILGIFLDIVRGLEYVHTQGLIHRDVKPQNIYWCQTAGVWKIGDFGLVTSGEGGRPESISSFSSLFAASSPEAASNLADVDNDGAERTTGVGTFTYASPEQLNELFVPFSTAMERALVLGRLREPSPLLPPEFVSWWPKQAALALWSIHPDPSKRPAAREILAYVESMKHIVSESKGTLSSSTAQPVAVSDPPSLPQGEAPTSSAMDPATYIRFLEDRLHSTQQECELLRVENARLRAMLSSVPNP